MMSTQPPDTATKPKSRRSLLPSLNFGSSSSAVSSSSLRTPLSSSAANLSSAEPDYFATVHVPDTNAPNPGAVRIASPFALATPLVSTSGARVASGPNATDTPSHEPEPHPWAKLFPDGGMTTALPDGFRMGKLGVPPTPAATATAVHDKMKLPGSGAHAHPPDSRRNLNLPPKLKGALSSSASLPLPAGSSSTNSSKASASTNDLTKFKALDVDGLAEALQPPSWKRQAKASSASSGSALSEDVLILDIRPSTSYSMARIASSINICAPSTLLKRPAITVERIEDEMLGSNSDRRRFMRWRKGPLKPKPNAKADTSDEASLEAVRKRGTTISLPDEPGVNRIIVLDTDTTRIDGAGNATAGGGGPCLIGVLKKFEAAGFAGELCWLVGGFNKLARSKKAQDFIDTGAPTKHVEDSSSSSPHSTRTQSPAADVQSREPPALKLNGVAATPSFGSAAEAEDQRKWLVQPRGLPMEAFQTQSTVAGWPGQSASPAKEASQRDGSRDGFRLNLANRQQSQNGGSNTDSNSNRAAQAGGANRSAAACANPFFDNIRQNRELQHGITEKIPMELPHMSHSQRQQLPPFLQKLVHLSEADRALALAQAFFDVEKAEQNRLIATMQQHSAESDQDPRSKDFASAQQAALLKLSSSEPATGHAFPFSIAAALERGADNRYNNIWTYEHSRVRLTKPQSAHDPGSDYLNGSHVHPPHRLGSKRRYIATQAPLPSTFAAFWTAVWEQNSRVIVMLTREHESGRLQSHPYWLNTAYGDSIRLTKLEEVVLDEAGQKMRSEECSGVLGKDQDGGALFPTMPSSQQNGDVSTVSDQKREPTTVRRTFLLKNLSEPQAAPRRIVQLQYIAWPDYHIPETPQSLLTLMDLADSMQNAADVELSSSPARGRGQNAGPMVVHCSAGVGRTGAFIVIDAALDVLRRVRRHQKITAAGRNPSSIPEPPPWENNLVADAAAADRSPNVDTTPDVDMAAPSSPLADRFPRTPRRSLKRELSPTGMDIDSGSNQGSSRDLSSPPPMFRSRSNESGGNGADASSLLSSSLSSTGSFSNRSGNAIGSKTSPGDTPMRSTQSMQAAPAAGGDSNTSGAPNAFTNPFTSPTFRFNPLASAKIRHAGSAMQNASSHDSAFSPRQQTEGGLSANAFGTDPAFSPTRSAGLQLSSQDAWRQASSPFSEVSTPSFQGGGSARSSFSSAVGVHSRLSSSGGNGLSPSGLDEGGRSIDEALMSAVNPFDLTISQQQQQQSQQGQNRAAGDDKAATAGDTTSSTITGSNEPTPFDASSSATSNIFGFTAQPPQEQSALGSSMSASNSAGSSCSSNDVLAARATGTPNTSAHSTPAHQESQTRGTGSSSSNEAVEAYVQGHDVIKAIVEGVREQRMSLIQTGRQFVFVYSAVLAGLLRDLSKEGVA